MFLCCLAKTFFSVFIYSVFVALYEISCSVNSFLLYVNLVVGESDGIHIPAIFVSKMAGETLKKFARGEDEECCINSSMDETAGTVLVMSFVSLVVIMSVLASFLFARNCRLLRHGVDNHPPYVKKQVVEKFPCSAYSAPCSSEDNFQEACAICLEDYNNGDMLRHLPCKHEFHKICIDSWLTKWGIFCPICKLEVTLGG
ncbi:Receptor y region, transmembrane domain- and RING domain-containing protein 1 [Zea mays]|uniref:Receptor y region, transmembrane domain-and RING domain-containing protein 1 n=1 Tax=Zea mays TaxID=4577 RepID=A0A3L6G732_MAIZE|nr:Receptor y region, transmembrane domain- and RING domain-containing protein 1 [Zea mays]